MAFNYPYGDTQQLNLNWFLSQWETFRAQWAAAEEGIDHALDAEIARVEEAMTDLYAARDAAAASKTAAQTAATNAASSATVATQQATLAQSYANTAQTQAGIATAAAEAAGNSASSASTSATAANLSKTQAANSATAAQTAQTAAEAAETNIVSIITDAIQDAADAAAATATADAEAAADAAEASATAAAGSASDASDSATAAAGSASDAADSATAAAGSATAAAGSATAAAGSASSAADSATAAAASAASIVVDSAMSDSSTNPVQNKVINGEITELKTAITQNDSRFTAAIDEFKPNILDPSKIVKNKLIDANNNISNSTSYEYIEYTPVIAGRKYSLAETKNGAVFSAIHTTRINVYKSNDLSSYTTISETTSGQYRYFTIPDGYDLVRIVLKYSELTNPDATLMLYDCTDGYATEIIEYGVVTKRKLNNSGYITADDLKFWKNKKWCVVGDSLTEVNAATTKHYFDYIQDTTGVSIQNLGVGGTGYVRGYDSSEAFYQRITSVANDADIVTIFGSGNDCNISAMSKFDGMTWSEALGTYTDNTTDTICGCINATLNAFFTAYPTKPIGIVAPTPWKTYPTTLTTNNRFEDYTAVLKQIAEYHGIPFLDLYHNSNLRPENEANRDACFYDSELDGNADGVHPNALGHSIIAPKFFEFIKTLMLFY